MVKILLSILPKKTDVLVFYLFYILPRLSTHNISMTQHHLLTCYSNTETKRKKEALILIVIIEMITLFLSQSHLLQSRV